ncbi:MULTISPECIES: sugar-binding transcriptional regulator [Mesobacillus]|uniref:Transcriptional regulator n=2 Tax=Mesobacillus TaxID=2675231 RepID=A0A0D6Z8G9_9BACI|nr:MULTISPECIES: sugar-binding transcriptional regulator [Mesobacillus]KIY22094.1 transcriptional regulator [Mesobacillus subterraneus]MDQ0415604.1 DNA-binding transcriptional regulator LsrR (DeoR family) [Mesobacillus stamsii]
MSLLEEKRLLVKVAQLYYEEGANQSEIANIVGVSRSLISKYLTKAKELGIVQISINEEGYHPFIALESELERIYKLREVICVPSIENDDSKHRLGLATSKYLLRMVKGTEIIGVSSGTTLYEVAKNMPSTLPKEQLQFVPLVGGVGNERVDIHANHIVASLAESLQARYHLLHVPVLMDSSEAKEVIMRQPSIKSIFDIASQSDIAIVGIGGTPKHSTMVKSYLDQNLEEFKSLNVVGDVCYNFINDEGEKSSHPWNEKVISLELEQLKKIPLVIGVASGKEKVDSIKAVLKGKLINVLITDEKTAKGLLVK